MLKKKLFLGLLILIAIIGIAGAGLFYWNAYHAKIGSPDGSTLARGYDLTLGDYDGNSVPLSDYRREPLVMYSFASWCVYCGEELKILDEKATEFSGQLTVLAINRAEPDLMARPYFESLNTSHIKYLNDPNDEFYKDIGGYAMPEVLFVNKDGTVVHQQRGPMSGEEMSEHMRALLDK